MTERRFAERYQKILRNSAVISATSVSSEHECCVIMIGLLECGKSEEARAINDENPLL